ncbi:MAG: hypothetical protein LBR73_04665 [Oscillospiraceae bacterium]|jgi:hypothetical protein|nr:hypothetical protein [Oscillospiraceae bacterium]
MNLEILLWAAVPVAAILCVLLWIAAMKRAKKHNAAFQANLAAAKAEEALRKRYKTLDKKTAAADPPEQAILGVGAHIQMKLEAAPHMTEAFEELTEFAKQIYALSYLIETGSVGNFFRIYAKPLTSYAQQAVEVYTDSVYAAAFRSFYAMYDSDDEAQSLLPAEEQAAARAAEENPPDWSFAKEDLLARWEELSCVEFS